MLAGTFRYSLFWTSRRLLRSRPKVSKTRTAQEKHVDTHSTPRTLAVSPRPWRITWRRVISPKFDPTRCLAVGYGVAYSISTLFSCGVTPRTGKPLLSRWREADQGEVLVSPRSARSLCCVFGIKQGSLSVKNNASTPHLSFVS